MNQGVFNNEGEMQQWISKELAKSDCLSELIVNSDDLDLLTPKNLTEKKIIESFKYCLESLDIVCVLSENKNIAFDSNNVLKPDFLLYAPESESMVIIELKHQVSPSRQAGTEISAYANEIKSYIPFISDGDIINVIISCVWPTLLKQYSFHEIFWLHRNVLCLEPVLEEGKIVLKIIDYKLIAQNAFSLQLSTRHLGGYHICLYDDNLYKDATNLTRLDSYLNQMKTSLSVLASKGNSQKSHGFAFLWKDDTHKSLSPYGITVINFAPFQAFERHFHQDGFNPNILSKAIINVITEHDPIGHGNSLNEIFKTGERFLKSFCKPRPEGFETWETLKVSMLELGTLISFKSWGIFEELYSEKLIQHYQEEEFDWSFDNPFLGLQLLDEVIDPEYDFYNVAYYDRSPDEDDFEF